MADCAITIYDKGTISSSSTITFNHEQGHIQKFTCGGAYTITFDFSNWPADEYRGWILVKATNMGLGTLAFAGTVNWKTSNDTYTMSFSDYFVDRNGETSLKTSGLDEFLFWNDGVSTGVYGMLI